MALAMSDASGPSSIMLTLAVLSASASRSTLFCAIRSARSRDDDGSLTPALMTTRRMGSFSLFSFIVISRLLAVRTRKAAAQIAQHGHLVGVEAGRDPVAHLPSMGRADAALLV